MDDHSVLMSDQGPVNKPKIDHSRLAALMLQWEQDRRAMLVTEAEIKEMVLAIGNTQTVGNVRATYSGGRKQYNYEGVCADIPIPLTVMKKHTTPQPAKIDWKSIAEEAGVEDIPFTQSPPSVTLKLIERKE